MSSADDDLLPARSIAESHMYLDLTPCRCGRRGFERTMSMDQRDDVLAVTYSGSCPECQAARSYTFAMSPTLHAPADPVLRFGAGLGRSRIIDPGQWVHVADAYASAVPVPADASDPTTREHLTIAAAAMTEVLSYVDPGTDQVPRSTITSDDGNAVYDADPGRFDRLRIEAVIDTFLELLNPGDESAQPEATS